MAAIKNDFNVNGFFYRDGQNEFRKYLNIIRKGETKDVPDLMVVMMNPGSSECLGSFDVESTAKPDPTQTGIMKIMNTCGFNYARVLNLSDLCEKSSKCFRSFLRNSDNDSRSIFSDKRKEEFDQYFIAEVPVIFGWGSHRALLPLIDKALKKIKAEKPLGVLKNNSDKFYYHPLVHTRYLNNGRWDSIVSDQYQQRT